MYLKIKLSLDKLYNDTLNFSYPYTGYACDEKNIFLGLQFRYEFIKLLLDYNFDLTEKQIEESSYFNFISKKIDDYPRDGGKDWIYDDPKLQIQRFKDTAKSILNHGYITKKNSTVINDFEKKTSNHIERNIENKVIKVNYILNNFQGLIQVRKVNNIFIVLNGHHRLAIMKVFKDLKKLEVKDKIEVKIFCNSIREFLKIFIF
tara:strand:+ start:1536 stop:2147 length:612 start_codon:yes stop_codon:yes gene_type:complete